MLKIPIANKQPSPLLISSAIDELERERERIKREKMLEKKNNLLSPFIHPDSAYIAFYKPRQISKPLTDSCYYRILAHNHLTTSLCQLSMAAYLHISFHRVR